MRIDPTAVRASTVLAAVIYMMTMYQRTRCPGLAHSIAAHLDCLARHPDIDDTIRQVASGMRQEWGTTARCVAAMTPESPSATRVLN